MGTGNVQSCGSRMSASERSFILLVLSSLGIGTFGDGAVKAPHDPTLPVKERKIHDLTVVCSAVGQTQCQLTPRPVTRREEPDVSDTHAERGGRAALRHPAHLFYAFHHRAACCRDRGRAGQPQQTGPPVLVQKRVPADELTLVHIDEMGEPRLKGCHRRVHVREIVENAARLPHAGCSSRGWRRIPFRTARRTPSGDPRAQRDWSYWRRSRSRSRARSCSPCARHTTSARRGRNSLNGSTSWYRRSRRPRPRS